MNDTPSPSRGTLSAEIAIIGTGPGGSVTACTLAEAGRDVLLIEEGPHLPVESCLPFTLDEMLQKYRNGGLTTALGSPKVQYVEGCCVGGGSEINSGLYHRTPPDVLRQWQQRFQCEGLSESSLTPHFEACERDLSVSKLPGAAPAASLKLLQGAETLGWSAMEVPRWFRYDQPSAGTTMPQGIRQSMTKTYVPRALKAGCRLLANTRISTLRRERGKWIIKGRCRHDSPPGAAVEITADKIFVCGGAVQTPALLRRSGIRNNIGDSLRLHATAKVVACFPETVNSADMGVPVHQVKQFAPRFSFGCSISSPPHLGVAMAGHPDAGDVLAGWEQCAVYYVMITGSGRGTVRNVPGFRDPVVRYKVAKDDLADLAVGLKQLCRLLLSAGATTLYPCLTNGPRITNLGDVERLPALLDSVTSNLMTIHLFSSCPMGEDRRICAADSFGRVHGFENLRIADASLLCGPPGVNPQGSIMAIARRNALSFVGKL